MSEIRITSKLSMPRTRFIEWFQGIRPAPGQDAEFFFKIGSEMGLYSREQAAELLERHRVLERREAGLPSTCGSCHGEPPSGFTCNACGEGAR